MFLLYRIMHSILNLAFDCVRVDIYYSFFQIDWLLARMKKSEKMSFSWFNFKNISFVN